MDYYNFYILKKLFKKYKKAFIIISLFLLLLIIRSKVFAFSPSPPVNYIGFTNEEKTLLQSFFSSINMPVVEGNSFKNILIHRSAENGYVFDILLYTDYMGTVYLSGNNTVTFQNYSTSNVKYKYYLYRLKSDGTKFGPALPSGSAYKNVNIVDSSCIGTNRNIYTDSSGNTILYPDVENSVVPIHISNDSDIPSWNFQTLNIIGDELFADTSRRTMYYYLDCTVNNSFTSTISVYKYGVKSESTNNFFTSIQIPRVQILKDYKISPNDSIEFILRQRFVDNSTNDEFYETYNLGTYTLSITQSEADDVNEQSELTQQQDQLNQLEDINDSLDDLNNNIQEQTEATEQLENTITDDTVESGAEDLPSTDVQDPTQNGIDNIFQSIYNAFCTGQAQDIVFPIPFTNENITLSPYYVRDMLNNNGAGWIYTLIQAFWGYLIGRYIVKDISKKITKIKSGDIENIENNNIKEDML